TWPLSRVLRHTGHVRRRAALHTSPGVHMRQSSREGTGDAQTTHGAGIATGDTLPWTGHYPGGEMHDHNHTEMSARGLQSDAGPLLDRRRLLGLFAGAGLAAVAGCSPSSSPSTPAPSSGASGRIPEETAGPYPGDGSNGPNILAQSGIVRS